MSSEVFEEMHKTLRKYKEHNSVDLLHPGSAMLYGKKYIAQNKVLILPKSQRSGRGYIDFDVPFENGHRVNFATDLHHEYNGHPILVQTNMYPETIRQDNGYTIHKYSQAPVETEEAEIKSLIDVDPEKFHKELSDLSQKPTKGFIHSVTNWNHMNEDNLQDFHRHHSKEQRELHNNETELFGPGEFPNRLLVNNGRDWYHYNIKTEQLRKIGS